MTKQDSSRLADRLHDGLIVGLVVGLVVGTAALAGLAGSAFADADTGGATREFANHIAHHSVAKR